VWHKPGVCKGQKVGPTASAERCGAAIRIVDDISAGCHIADVHASRHSRRSPVGHARGARVPAGLSHLPKNQRLPRAHRSSGHRRSSAPHRLVSPQTPVLEDSFESRFSHHQPSAGLICECAVQGAAKLANVIRGPTELELRHERRDWIRPPPGSSGAVRR